MTTNTLVATLVST